MQKQTIVPFIPFPGATTYRPEFCLVEGAKRRRWVVIERSPDGTEVALSVYRGKKSEAFGMAEIWTIAEARRNRDIEALRKNDLGRTILSLSVEDRKTMIMLCEAANRLTGAVK